jgi:hypothetical protein
MNHYTINGQTHVVINGKLYQAELGVSDWTVWNLTKKSRLQPYEGGDNRERTWKSRRAKALWPAMGAAVGRMGRMMIGENSLSPAVPQRRRAASLRPHSLICGRGLWKG